MSTFFNSESKNRQMSNNWAVCIFSKFLLTFPIWHFRNLADALMQVYCSECNNKHKQTKKSDSKMTKITSSQNSKSKGVIQDSSVCVCVHCPKTVGQLMPYMCKHIQWLCWDEPNILYQAWPGFQAMLANPLTQVEPIHFAACGSFSWALSHMANPTL